MRDDVLIIGAGPSGLFAAAELARHGVGARLVERDVLPSRRGRLHRYIDVDLYPGRTP